MRPGRTLTPLVVCAVVSACVGTGGGGGSAAWPQWQTIEAPDVPETWRVEEASFAFDAWSAEAVVTDFTATVDLTTVRFEDERGGSAEIRLAGLPRGRGEPVLSEGMSVRLGLIQRRGFEGIAHGLTVFDVAGRMLLLYDDGGYGPAYYGPNERAGLVVERDLGAGSPLERWARRDATFRLDDQSVTLAEGRSAELGSTGLVVRVVVSREWTGDPMTDVDLSPLAYLVYRVRG